MPTNAINDTGVKYLYDKLHGEIEPVAEAVSTDETTIEGNPINFSTLSAQTAQSTIIDLEPIQDLHGYDKPWVGGTGKNLIPMTVTWLKKLNSSGTWTNNNYEYNGITWTLNLDSDENVISIGANGTASNRSTFRFADRTQANVHLSTGNYILSIDSKTQVNKLYVGKTSSESWSQLAATTYADASFSVDVADDLGIHIDISQYIQVNNEVFQPMIRVATDSDRTYAPYENKASISGRTEIGILGCGKNLFNPDTFVRGLINYINGEVLGNTSWITSDYIECQGTVTLQGWKDGTEGNFCVRFCEYASDKSFIKNTNNVNTSDVITYSKIITLDSNTRYIRASFGFDNKTTTIPAFFATNRLMLELGSQATPYEPYTKSNDLTIQLGQTVYGGTLDVENGVLVMDRVCDTFDGSNDETIEVVVGQAFNRICCTISSNSITNSDTGAKTNKIWSDKYTETTDNLSNAGEIGIYYRANGSHKAMISTGEVGVTDVASARIWLSNNPTQICYTLATPITINLTPNVITLLEGVNNISTDGDKITLTYRDGSVATLADVKALGDNLTQEIADSQILTDTVTGDKYKLVVTSGVLSIEQISN